MMQEHYIVDEFGLKVGPVERHVREVVDTAVKAKAVLNNPESHLADVLSASFDAAKPAMTLRSLAYGIDSITAEVIELQQGYVKILEDAFNGDGPSMRQLGIVNEKLAEIRERLEKLPTY